MEMELVVSRTCLGRAGSCLGFRGRVFFCFVGFLGVLFSFLSIGWLVREGWGVSRASLCRAGSSLGFLRIFLLLHGLFRA